MGWHARDRLPDLYAKALDGLKPGEVSGVIRSPAGFHLIKLIDRRGGGAPAMVEQTHARHILVKTSEIVSAADAKRKLENLRDRIVHGADFAELARLNSDDPSSVKGGDLGWIYPGDTVPEFEREMNSLKVGEVSQPFETPFGWHLAQVLARREAPYPASASGRRPAGPRASARPTRPIRSGCASCATARSWNTVRTITEPAQSARLGRPA